MVDASIVIFAVLSIVGVLLSVLVFILKDILHAAAALALLFFVNSLFFLLLGQPLLAVIQLFIMVGGITTFIFVGVASAPYSRFRFTKKLFFVAVWTVFFMALVYPLSGVQISPPQNQVTSFGTVSIATSLSSASTLFYLILLLMFGVALGAVLLLRKAGAKK